MQKQDNYDWKSAIVCANAFLQIAEPLAHNIGKNIPEGRQRQHPEPYFGNMVASATNLSFAIEIFIKLILFVSDINIPKHHNLGKLYSIIPRDFKVVINKYYQEHLKEWIGKSPSITVAVSSNPTGFPKWDDSTSNDIESLFARTGDIFSSWRYIFEFTSPGKGEYQYRHFEYGLLIAACKAIKATIEFSQGPPIECN